MARSMQRSTLTIRPWRDQCNDVGSQYVHGAVNATTQAHNASMAWSMQRCRLTMHPWRGQCNDVGSQCIHGVVDATMYTIKFRCRHIFSQVGTIKFRCRHIFSQVGAIKFRYHHMQETHGMCSPSSKYMVWETCGTILGRLATPRESIQPNTKIDSKLQAELRFAISFARLYVFVGQLVNSLVGWRVARAGNAWCMWYAQEACVMCGHDPEPV